MKSLDIDFKTVKIKDLVKFAEEASQSTSFELIPMIRSRAISLAQNPVADPDDIVRLAFKLTLERKAYKIQFSPAILKQCTFAWLIPFRKRMVNDTYCVWAKDPVLSEALLAVDAKMTDGDLPFW